MDLIEQMRVLLEYRESVEEPAVYIKWFLQPSGYLWWVLSRLPGICWTHTEILGKAFFSASAKKIYKQDIQRHMIHVIFPYSPTLYLFLITWVSWPTQTKLMVDRFPQLNHQGPGPIKDCLDRVGRGAMRSWNHHGETACERSSRSTLKCQRNWRSYEALGWKTL